MADNGDGNLEAFAIQFSKLVAIMERVNVDKDFDIARLRILRQEVDGTQVFQAITLQLLPQWLSVEAGGIALQREVLRRHGYPALQVHYLGKAATFLLLYAFPLLLLAHGDNPVAAVAAPLAWALTIWGTVLYLVAGALYVVQAVGLLRADRSSAAAGTAS